MTMDPEATMRLIREAIDHAEQAVTDEDEDAELASLRELRNAFEDLDQWIRRGGVPPRAWTRDHPTIHRDDYPIKVLPEVPADWPVQPIGPDDDARDRVTCGTCHRSWDDAIATAYTPAPAARCPFEAYH